MPRSTLYVHRYKPYALTLSISKGNDFDLRFPLEDENEDAITSGTFTSLNLIIRKDTADFDNEQDVCNVAMGAMTIVLPNVDVPVNVVAATVDWANQQKGDYKAKLIGDYNGRTATPSLFRIKVTD